MHWLYYKQKNFNPFTRWCFKEILIPAPSPAIGARMQFVYALMRQDFGELAIYAKAPVFPGRAVHSWEGGEGAKGGGDYR